MRLNDAIQNYRRALADNDDVLSEFLVLWTSLESLDCVYRRVFPARNAQFQDGLKEVFRRLHKPDSFNELEPLRHGLAHGFIGLAQATETATANIDLVRTALRLMVMRIIGCDEAVASQVADRPSIKGVYLPHLRIVGTIQTDAPDVSDFGNQPDVEAMYDDQVKTERNGDKLTYSPSPRFRLMKPNSLLTVLGYEMWGEKNALLNVTARATAQVIKAGQN